MKLKRIKIGKELNLRPHTCRKKNNIEENLRDNRLIISSLNLFPLTALIKINTLTVTQTKKTKNPYTT